MSVKRVIIRPPTRPSAGARTLRHLLEGVALLSRRNEIPRQYHTVINWGNATPLLTREGVRVLNNPAEVGTAINKLKAFDTFYDTGVTFPDYWTEKDCVEHEGIILARHTLTGSAGEGIQVVRPGDDLPDAPMYVRYIPKREEYRVHVICGRAVFVQQKRRRSDAEQDRDQRLIRNHDNGWVFAVENVDPPTNVLGESIRAVAALGLSFGAVDVIVGRDDGEAYVLEVNTAPGIESPTLCEVYQREFLKEVQ